MRPLSQPSVGIRIQIGAAALKLVLILFGATVVGSLGYLLWVSLTTDTLAPQQIVLQSAVMVVSFVLGWLIDKKHSGHTIALLFLLMAYSSAAGYVAGAIKLLNGAYPGPFVTQIDAAVLTIGHVAWIPGVFFPLFLIPLFFPTGKLLSRRWRLVVAAFGSIVIMMALAIILRPWPWELNDIPDTRTPNGIAGSEQFFDMVSSALILLTPLAVLSVPVAVVLRYRRAQGVERTQIKWPVATIVAFLCLSVVVWAVPELNTLDAKLGYPITWIMSLMLPLAIGIAILRHNLFDINLIINRTLVYSILTVVVVVLYVVTVSTLSILIQTQTSFFSGLVATGIIAVIFQPMRDRLQKIVNRIMYGERDDPAAVLSRLAYHLETAGTPAAILPNLVQTIAQTLKIPYVAIWLTTASDQMEVVAEEGDPPEQREMISLTYQNSTIGYLVVAPRSRNEHFSASEQMLLATIAALTAITVRAVQLSDELRQSRLRIVTAREEERRRIRRDLHDGLGPQLASQTLGLGAVAQLMPNNQQKALALLESLQAQAHEAILDVRRLVYDLRPPALDDLGLVEALRQSTSRYETGRLHFTFEAHDMQVDLPAAVETAAFRIAQEAITNVIRHADATRCSVRLACTDDDMIIEIQDDGCGLPETYHAGIGLHAMCERATELNGLTIIESPAAGGTRVWTKLPLEFSDE